MTEDARRWFVYDSAKDAFVVQGSTNQSNSRRSSPWPLTRRTWAASVLHCMSLLLASQYIDWDLVAFKLNEVREDFFVNHIVMVLALVVGVLTTSPNLSSVMSIVLNTLSTCKIR